MFLGECSLPIDVASGREKKEGVCAIKDDLLANMRPTINLHATFHTGYENLNNFVLLELLTHIPDKH